MSRVAFISVHGCPFARLGGKDTGGMNVYLLRVAKELAATGVGVDIYTRSHNPGDAEVFEIGDDVRLVHIDAGPLNEPKEGLFNYLPDFLQNLYYFIHRTGVQYDVVHSHYWLSGWVGSRFAAALELPHVVTFHTLAEAKRQATNEEPDVSARYVTERKVANDADFVVCFTEHEATLLARSYGVSRAAIKVIPCGVDTDMFRPRDKAEARSRLGVTEKYVVLFVGRIEPIKALGTLIQAVELVEDTSSLRVLVVGGDSYGPEYQRVQSMCYSLGIDDNVSFVGSVPQMELPIYYNAADILVVPSKYESFGLVALEALATGTPVIASRVGGLATIVQDTKTGFLIPWQCPDAFARKLEILLANESILEAMAVEARKSAMVYSWSSVGEELSKLYASSVLQRVGSAL